MPTKEPWPFSLDALVVDRDPGIRSEVKHALTGMGFCVTETDDGRHAKAIVENTPCLDLLVTETHPPQVGGHMLAESYLVACPLGCVVLMSHHENVDAINAESTARWAFLPRERAARLVREAVKSMIYRRRAIVVTEADPSPTPKDGCC